MLGISGAVPVTDLDQGPEAFRYAQEHLFHPANSYYTSMGNAGSSTGVPQVGDLYGFPFFSGGGGEIDQIGFNVTVAGGAGSVARAGIYKSDASGFGLLPGKLLFDGGQFDTTIAGAKIANVVPNVALLPKRLYWLAFIIGVAAPTVTTLSNINTTMGRNANFNSQFGVQKVGHGYGALPADWPAGSGTNSSAPAMIVVRFAKYNRLYIPEP